MEKRQLFMSEIKYFFKIDDLLNRGSSLPFATSENALSKLRIFRLQFNKL